MSVSYSYLYKWGALKAVKYPRPWKDLEGKRGNQGVDGGADLMQKPPSLNPKSKTPHTIK